MICNKCNKGKMRPIKAGAGEVEYECELCKNRYIKKYDSSNYSLEIIKDNYESPEKWAEQTIKSYSFHGEIPKEYLERLKSCKTWDDVLILEKEVIPYLLR